MAIKPIPLYEHNQVDKPTGPGWWWVMEAGRAPKKVKIVNLGETRTQYGKLVAVGDYSKGTESVYLHHVYPLPLYTGPIPEPPKGGAR